MNKITHLSTTFSPIIIPKFDGLAKPAIRFSHEIDRMENNNLKIKITVFLSLKEFLGTTVFEIVNATSEFKIEINNYLTTEDVFNTFIESFKLFRSSFLQFELSNNMNPINIQPPTFNEMKNFSSDIVAWYYSP